VDENLEAADCSMKAQMQIDVAVEEIFVNIAQYVYTPKEGEAVIQLDTETVPGAAIITFIDSGIPFNPLAVEEPDVTLSAKDRKVGGLGIFMVRRSMDDVQYEYADNKNILTIKKNI
jgi:anti-sigma regulatory factor (Ser/Thr protein kinase)